MSTYAATARGFSPTLPSCIEITKICDSANATRWRNWSSPLIAPFQNALIVPSWPIVPVALAALTAASAASQSARCEACGFASCSLIQAA